MKILKMNKYGSVLTGREFGKDTMEKIARNIEYPVCLDFEGVNSLGSSFADEVLIPIARNQGNKITVIHVKMPVWDCIQDVAIDGKIEIFKKVDN